MEGKLLFNGLVVVEYGCAEQGINKCSITANTGQI